MTSEMTLKFKVRGQRHSVTQCVQKFAELSII